MAMGNGKKKVLGLQLMLGTAVRFMGKADGPRVAFVEDDGWDTHANEAAILTRKLAELDAGLQVFHDTIGPLWSRTLIVVATEFGRTAHVNGTGGTDHGTGGSLFLAGGALHGGRVAGQWPGMSTSELYEQRDVHATTDFRSVFKGVLMDHMGVAESVLESQVFPGSVGAKPMTGLVRKVGAAV
jgi:uncharacterized protein (DUF1501 family)